LRVRLPGSTDDAIKLELRNAVREFAVRSGAFTWDLEVPLEEGVGEYELQLPFGSAVILYVYRVTVDGWPKPLVQYDEPVLRPYSYAYGEDRSVLEISPIPLAADAGKIMKVVVSTTPIGEFENVDDTLSYIGFEYFLDGALGKLHSHMGKPYSNMVLAQYHLKRFNNGIAFGRDLVRRRYSMTETEFKFPPFAGRPGWTQR